MSPHILIDQALEGVADPNSQSDIDAVVQGLITTAALGAAAYFAVMHLASVG
ncbi:hypothetical protein [Pseudomonas sp. LD120]|uniref:hypothetical protein n=1 Tax=Pseudomonas sp. LD120 TaxID=485751 RepID=UPI0015B4B804|nr:hypothetical protein [Pseudomonas sp. LD120]